MTGPYDEFRQLLQQKRFRDAVHLAERQILQSPSPDAFWLTQQALALLRTEDYGPALESARKALAAEPSNQYAVVTAADALLGLQKHEEALACYQECLGSPRLAARARKGVLDSLSRLKRWEEMLARLAEWAPPEEESAAWKVKALAGLKRTEEAIAECRAWLAKMPDHPPALWALTELEVERDGLEPVLERIGRMVRIPSLPPVYREMYASLCRRAGRPEEALKEYEKLEAQGAGSRASRQQAFLLAKTGKEREAIPLLEELLRADPRDMYLHSSYEAACRRVGEPERAINFYQTLLSLHPEAKGLYGRIKALHRALERAP
jgi:tetratricopeptide (TPR) repeat protein